MSKYLERKQKLVNKYNTNIPELTAEQIQWALDNYDKKIHGNGIDWSVIAHAVDGETLMLRYVVTHKYHCNELSVEERARMVIDSKGKVLMFEKWNTDDVWRNTRCCYFRGASHYRYWVRQNFYCRDTQKLMPGFVEEIKNLNAFKYFDTTRYFENNPWICIEDTMKRLMDRADIYEKLDKVGLNNVSQKDFSAYKDDVFKYNKSETSLLKMLDIDRNEFEVLRKYQDAGCIPFVKMHRGITPSEIELAMRCKWNDRLFERVHSYHISTGKLNRYMEMNPNITMDEYLHYVGNLKALSYPLDDYYLFPKDFYEADIKVSNEFKNDSDNRKDITIKKLADAMRKDKAFKEFFDGSHGLLVKVPESAEELYLEGRKLHNCLRTYVDRVARGDSLIFFVREIDKPDDAFVAMEYSHGRIVQCRYDHNIAVDDKHIIQFTELLAMRLREKERRAA